MVTLSYPRTSERARGQAGPAPGRGLSPSERVRLHSTECRNWAFFAGVLFCLGFPVINFDIWGALALWGIAGGLAYQANKSWWAFIDAATEDATWVGFYIGRKKAIQEFQAKGLEA